MIPFKQYALIALMGSISFSTMAQKSSYPETKKVKQVDDYFGTKVADPYRWLENDTSAETADWVKRQNEYTQNYLQKIPYRNEIVSKLTKIWNYPKSSAPFKEGPYYLTYKNDGLQNQSVLYYQEQLDAEPQILLDPNTLSQDGTVALQAIAFSKNQKYFAYAVSASGSDWQEIYILDFKTKKIIDSKIEYVKFTGISWLGDEGFYYSAYDAPINEATKFSNKTEYQKIKYHKIGSHPKEDIVIYEDKEHPLRYVGAQLTEDERFLILSISEGTDGSEIKVKDLKQKQKDFTTLIPGFKYNAAVVDNFGDKLLVHTNKDAANYKLVWMDPKNPATEQTFIAENRMKLESASTGGGKIFVQYQNKTCTKVFQYNQEGKREFEIKLPALGTASGFGCHKNEHSFYYTFTNYVYPPTVYKYDILTGQSELYQKSAVDFNPDDYESNLVQYRSKDSTLCTMFITHKKGIALNGMNPCLLYGYGGFNISLTPAFSVSNLVFLESGGIYCVANLRGGGEYGEAWHKGGMLEKKQNVFDDFIAAAEYLIQNKYTNSSKLAIKGGSNGGLLVGACMTQRPELFAVALPQVGVLDMLRYQKFTVGWGWAVEYGSSDHKEQFDYLIKYSPLHNLKKGVCYPATMIGTADHDDRVVPAHSFKFAAQLQENQSCSKPTLIRIDSKAGHGAGKPTAKLIEEAADVWSFIFYNTQSKPEFILHH